MDISFIADHEVKPQFTAGANYEGTITEVDDKDTGVTIRLQFEEISTPAFWHFNLTNENEDAKRISMDELKGVMDQLDEPVKDSAELVGKKITVRLVSQSDSSLPKCALPVQTKRGNALAL
jgi:hypothetical protein